MTLLDTELFITRLINAPPSAVWQAWSRADLLIKWWIPAPMECKVIKLDLRPGGGFETQMRQGDDAFSPHVEGCFLDVAPNQRLVWTTCLGDGWRPLEPWLALTAEITFTAEGSGTRYSCLVKHKTAADSKKHADLGFADGWGQTIDQLAALVSQQA
jgi:uncharacterized protein YndB with AHSA1/START domain